MLYGDIVSVDAAAKSVRIKSEDENDREIDVILPVSEGTITQVDGRGAALSELAAGQSVIVRRTGDKISAEAIQATTPPADAND